MIASRSLFVWVPLRVPLRVPSVDGQNPALHIIRNIP